MYHTTMIRLSPGTVGDMAHVSLLVEKADFQHKRLVYPFLRVSQTCSLVNFRKLMFERDVNYLAASSTVYYELLKSSLAIVSLYIHFLHAGDLIIIEDVAYYTIYGVDTIVSTMYLPCCML